MHVCAYVDLNECTHACIVAPALDFCILFLFLSHPMCRCVYANMRARTHTHTHALHACGCPRGPEEGVGCSGTGVIGGYNPPDIGAGCPAQTL